MVNLNKKYKAEYDQALRLSAEAMKKEIAWRYAILRDDDIGIAVYNSD